VTIINLLLISNFHICYVLVCLHIISLKYNYLVFIFLGYLVYLVGYK
jgi:hypothetical protein